MDAIVPGGVSARSRSRMPPPKCARSASCSIARFASCATSTTITRDCRTDFATAASSPTELAAKLGLCGFAARASGVPDDLRCDFPLAPYDALTVRRAGNRDGDVAARVAVRFDEALESLRLIDVILDALAAGRRSRLRCRRLREFRPAVGCVEGWRGPVWLALESGPVRSIRRCHPHDPSWQNWPVIEHAVIGNIVPDFPLINKSFNLSYSGHDL